VIRDFPRISAASLAIGIVLSHSLCEYISAYHWSQLGPRLEDKPLMLGEVNILTGIE
jgi:hypothetical protein